MPEPGDPLEPIVEWYQHQPLLRGLINLVGIGSAIDVAITTKAQIIQDERQRIFFNELKDGRIAITKELVEKEEFLHAYFATARAALRTRLREKIQLFSRLFKTFCKSNQWDQIEGYEEALSILDDLSYREFQILLVLRELQKKIPQAESQTQLQKTNEIWEEFLLKVESQLGVPKSEIAGNLARLNRSGLYKTYSGAILGYGGDKGEVTPNFESFLKALGMA